MCRTLKNVFGTTRELHSYVWDEARSETLRKYFFTPQWAVYFEIVLLYPSMHLQGSRQITISFQEHGNKNI